jgi:hypothetical protein
MHGDREIPGPIAFRRLIQFAMQPFRHTGSALISAGVKESFPDLAVTYCGVVDLFPLIIGQRIERGKNISDIPRLLVCARKSESTE